MAAPYNFAIIPITPLPIGVSEIINPLVIKMVGKVEADEDGYEASDEMEWYDRDSQEKMATKQQLAALNPNGVTKFTNRRKR